VCRLLREALETLFVALRWIQSPPAMPGMSETARPQAGSKVLNWSATTRHRIPQAMPSPAGLANSFLHAGSPSGQATRRMMRQQLGDSAGIGRSRSKETVETTIPPLMRAQPLSRKPASLRRQPTFSKDG